MSDDFYQAYTLPVPTVFEDFGDEKVETGLLDSRGNSIYKSNPQAKPPIGFHRPSSLATKEIITRK